MKTTFEGVRISAKLINEDIEQTTQPKDSARTLYCNQFRVSLSKDGKRASFLYHGSHQDWQNQKTELSEKDLLNALYCFVSDAESGEEPFEDFCANFGYDEDSRTAERIYKACKKSAEKLQRLNFNSYLIAKIYDTNN